MPPTIKHADGAIEGTRWRAAGVPAGMQFAPQFGFQGAEDEDFSESVICTDEEVDRRMSAEQYGERQVARLKLFAQDLKCSPLAAPPELLPGDHSALSVSLTHDKKLVRQMHAFVRKEGRIGTVVWTYREARDGKKRFWEILSALRLD